MCPRTRVNSTPDLIILDDLFLARGIREHAAEVLQAIGKRLGIPP
jgi:DNA replication protein DnaC